MTRLSISSSFFDRLPKTITSLKSNLSQILPYLLPVFTYLLLFTFAIPLIPNNYLPPIHTKILPYLDTHFFFSSHLWFYTKHPHPLFDILAAIPYLIHPITPFLYIFLIRPFCTTKPQILHYVLIFGIMNTLSVLTNILFPTTPPWYFIKYGATSATYAMKGEAGLLTRVDELFGMELFEKMYRDGGKVVFGSWPSLHAAWPFLMAWFQPGIKWRGGRWALWGYCAWVWWAAMYLRHHYLVDLLGGMAYALTACWLGGKVIGSLEKEEDYLPVYQNEQSS